MIALGSISRTTTPAGGVARPLPLSRAVWPAPVVIEDSYHIDFAKRTCKVQY